MPCWQFCHVHFLTDFFTISEHLSSNQCSECIPTEIFLSYGCPPPEKPHSEMWVKVLAGLISRQRVGVGLEVNEHNICNEEIQSPHVLNLARKLLQCFRHCTATATAGSRHPNQCQTPTALTKCISNQGNGTNSSRTLWIMQALIWTVYS